MCGDRMLLSTTVEQRWNAKNKTRYVGLGYTFTAMRDSFRCKVEDLPHGSHVLVDVMCDYCGITYQKPWHRYLTELGSTKTDACDKCKTRKAYAEADMITPGIRPWFTKEANAKRAATNMAKYGAENVFASEIVKQKISDYWQTNFGVAGPTQLDECKEKTRETCMKKYGVPNVGAAFPMRGSDSPRWKGGVAHHRQERSTFEYRNWRDGVYGRDHYFCRICGQHSGRLEAHHLFDWKRYPELRYNVDNGVTLCESCHKAFHSQYGKHGNDPAQFLQFFQDAMVKIYADLQGTQPVEPPDKKLEG